MQRGPLRHVRQRGKSRNDQVRDVYVAWWTDRSRSSFPSTGHPRRRHESQDGRQPGAPGSPFFWTNLDFRGRPERTSLTLIGTMVRTPLNQFRRNATTCSPARQCRVTELEHPPSPFRDAIRSPALQRWVGVTNKKSPSDGISQPSAGVPRINDPGFRSLGD